jgi:hypothetical protein
MIAQTTQTPTYRLAAGAAAALVLSLLLAAPPAQAGGPGSRMAKPSVSGSNFDARRGNASGPGKGRGDINVGNEVNVDIDRDVNIDNDYNHWGPGYRYPVAAGVVIGTVAVTTAAVAGAHYYALPPGCTVVYRANETYYLCGSVYYRRTWYSNDVVYVVVNP